MGIDGLVRETPVRRRRISYLLVIALAASAGLFAGTKLPRGRSCEPVEPVDRVSAQRESAETLLEQGCYTPEIAQRSFAEHDIGHDRHAYYVRKLCILISQGFQTLPAALRALDGQTRSYLLALLAKSSGHTPRVADLLFDFLPVDRVPNLHAAVRYNLGRGNTARAREQLAAQLAAFEQARASHHFIDASYVQINKLLLAGLDAQAQAAGGSNR